MRTHPVGRVSEIPPGSRRIVEVDGRSIGVFNVGGRFYALRNICPHQGAPLCLGSVGGTAVPSRPGEYVWAREGEILTCPWHGWEFDLTTGRSVFNPHRTRVRSYDVSVRSGSDEDPAVPTFPVSVDDGVVLLHL
ncbi:MAG TPA: Rieske 2Fe-2S domain-containing protein [Pseudonocardia sp.]|jgi:nitrite reductase/ring-hydroxylating ferredoxin subunit|nr:Rieske 2Fe-2S domain-containing protein [Pseudonocardia sp.]